MTASNRTPIQIPLPIDNAVIEVPLTKGYATVIDACDADLTLMSWYADDGLHDTLPRARRSHYIGGGRKNPKKVHVWLHRVILERMLERPLASNEQVDHIDGNPMNNRRSNLRVATLTENIRNVGTRRNNTSGYKGVQYLRKRNRWRARLYHNGKNLHIGTFDTPEEAQAAYWKKAQELHGEFARKE